MKKYFCVVLSLLIAVFFVGNISFCEASKKVIAVTTIVNSCGGSYGRLAAQDIENQMTTLLVKSGMYDVVERTHLDRVIKELCLQDTGLIYENTAIEFGQLTGADFTLVGNVTGAEVFTSNNLLYKSTKAKVKFNFRFIDNKTGKVKISEMIEGSNTSSEFENKHPSKKQLMSNAVNDLSRKIVDKINELNPLSGTVVEISGGTVYIDLGSDSGVRQGEEYTIYREGKVIYHPITGDILGVEEEFVGTMKITDVKSNYAVGKLKKNEGAVKKGDKVKRSRK